MKNYVNDVPAGDQMINSSVVSFLGSPEASLRILVLGNSITRHGPKEDIGWPYDWGMAASAPEKDYVHRLYDLLTQSGKEVFMRIRQASSWEVRIREEGVLSEFEDDRAFNADLVIFRLGENVKKENVPYMEAATKEFMEYFCADGAKGIMTTCFNWSKAEKDQAILAVAEQLGFPCVDIGCTEERFMALGKFEHHGVSTHPGDEGMEMIAEKIFELISEII